MLLLPTQRHHWIVPFLLAALSIIGFAFEPFTSDLFAYNRTAIETGQYWRLLTGHILHTNAAHLLLNILGLALLWALHGDYYTPKNLSIFLILCGITTSIAIYVFSAEMIWYVGLSGVLHGLFVWGAYVDIRRKEATAWLLMIGVSIKIGYEQLGGDTQDIAELIGASVAVDAHLYGAMSGLILAIVQQIWSSNSIVKDD